MEVEGLRLKIYTSSTTWCTFEEGVRLEFTACVQLKQIFFECEILNIFLSISFNILYFGCSKESFH